MNIKLIIENNCFFEFAFGKSTISHVSPPNGFLFAMKIFSPFEKKFSTTADDDKAVLCVKKGSYIEG